MWIRVLLLNLLARGEESCRNRCGMVDLGSLCDCSLSCTTLGKCCSDYAQLCQAAAPPPAATVSPVSPVPPLAPVTPVAGMASPADFEEEAVEPQRPKLAAPQLSGSVSVGDAELVASETCPAFEGEVHLTVGGKQRMAILYLPEGATKAALWLIVHGTNQHARGFLEYTGLRDFAKLKGFAYLALQAIPSAAMQNKIRFNVGPNAMPVAGAPVDKAYVNQLLDQVGQLPCLDMRRVHCTGYSNGGRFCSRLGAALSQRIASISPVSGLRFPEPNHATRPVPILALHGEQDPVNPWAGHGAAYWTESVMEAAERWAQLNGCGLANEEWKRLVHFEGFSMAVYDSCREAATVEVMQLHGAGHQWPGATFEIPGIGKVSEYAANEAIYDFFQKHPMSPKPQFV